MKKSAGILAYRIQSGEIEVLLVHPGGPFWKNKDAGAWSIPKGETDEDEEDQLAARREFQEETGFKVTGKLTDLGSVRQKSGKWIHAFAVKKDLDAGKIISNEFELEWPPRSGKKIRVPEVDKAAWFTLHEAGIKINAGQAPLLLKLQSLINT